MRDHAVRKMMVLLRMGVEYYAKIAMTTLPGLFSTMGLLPKQDLLRLVFLDACADSNC